MADKAYYILFHSHTEGLALHADLKAQSFHPRIAPAPPNIVACCGMSLLINAEEIAEVRNFMQEQASAHEKIVELENQINPNRDKYC